MAFADAVSGEKISICELYKFTLKDSSELFFGAPISSVTFLGDVYSPAPITREGTVKKSNLSVGEIMIRLPRHDDYIDVSELMNGYLDYATITIYQVDKTNVANYRVYFIGKSGDVTWNYHVVETKFRDKWNDMYKLVPNKCFCVSCPHRLGDSSCGITIDDFMETGTAEGGSSTSLIVDTANRTEADDYWQAGYVEITSGNANGDKREVKIYTTGNITPMVAFKSAIQAGDTYKVRPFCQNLYDLCDSIFSNTDKNSGYKEIPQPAEVLI